MDEQPKPGPFEKATAMLARTVINRVLGNIMEAWGPVDLTIAIGMDVNLVQDALANFPAEMAKGKSIAGIFPKADRFLFGPIIYNWMERNYPQLFHDPQLGDILASPTGRAWFMKNVEAFRQYFWPNGSGT